MLILAVNMKLLYFHEYKSEYFYSTNIVLINLFIYFSLQYCIGFAIH